MAERGFLDVAAPLPDVLEEPCVVELAELFGELEFALLDLAWELVAGLRCVPERFGVLAGRRSGVPELSGVLAARPWGVPDPSGV
ncbi:MAG: hypothetical protein M3018_05085, partial [Actinomycetota bacterium]|nr:hypothetical protein [Actinomycetota bacterium]